MYAYISRLAFILHTIQSLCMLSKNVQIVWYYFGPHGSFLAGVSLDPQGLNGTS